MNEELAKARAILDEESWIDEISILNDDGEPDDCACRVFRVDDMRDALDRIEAEAKRERERLRAALEEIARYEEGIVGCVVSGHASGIDWEGITFVMIQTAKDALGAGETPKGKGVGV